MREKKGWEEVGGGGGEREREREREREMIKGNESKKGVCVCV